MAARRPDGRGGEGRGGGGGEGEERGEYGMRGLSGASRPSSAGVGFPEWERGLKAQLPARVTTKNTHKIDNWGKNLPGYNPATQLPSPMLPHFLNLTVPPGLCRELLAAKRASQFPKCTRESGGNGGG